MIVKHVDKHTGIAPSLRRNSRAAPNKGWLRFGKVINGAMKCHTPGQVVRQATGQGTLYPVPNDPADKQRSIFTCKKRMGQEVQYDFLGNGPLTALLIGTMCKLAYRIFLETPISPPAILGPSNL